MMRRCRSHFALAETLWHRGGLDAGKGLSPCILGIQSNPGENSLNPPAHLLVRQGAHACSSTAALLGCAAAARLSSSRPPAAVMAALLPSLLASCRSSPGQTLTAYQISHGRAYTSAAAA